jgi:hypothetical protein
MDLKDELDWQQQGRDWLAPDLTSALLHIEQGVGLALGCKVTPRGSGYSSTQDNRDNLRPVLGRLVGLVGLAVMLDVAARRRSASACNCTELIRCRHPALPKTVKTSLTRRWRSACARGLFFLVIRDGSLTASIGTTEFESWLSSEREMLEPACSKLPSCLFVAAFPKIHVRTATHRRLGLGRDVSISSRGSAVLCAVSVWYQQNIPPFRPSYFQPVIDVQYLADVPKTKLHTHGHA